jgi:catechol 2,3-dioxygenase-like lactoylglutathione lyase family enzyme
MIKVRSLDHFVLRIRDLDASLAFYRDLLGLEILFLKEYKANERPFVSARVGEQLLDLVPDPTFDPETGKMAGGYMHCCVEVENKLAEVMPYLKERGLTLIDDQPVPRMGARGIGLSIYILDPDGYVVELKEANL